ncbi:MAG: glycosyltransferase [Hyphomicrobiales bacterium]
MPAIDRASIGVDDDHILLLSLGRLEDIKGFQDVISALPSLPENIVYAIAGEGPMEQNLRELASQLGVTHRVKFLGWRSDQAALLAASDICMVPSHHEPLGNVVLEAWCLKVPVIAARAEGPSWLIEDGVTGLLHEIGNIDQICICISQLTEGNELERDLIVSAFHDWHSKFSKKEICDKYIEKFQNIQPDCNA